MKPIYNLIGSPTRNGSEPFCEQDSMLVPVFLVAGNSGKWSNSSELPPEIGTRVRCKFNGLGYGTVQSYFVESGWLGVAVKLEVNPEWRKKTLDDAALVFGSEITQKL